MHAVPPSLAAETIGVRLKRLRLEQGLSQRELASPGVSYAYISRIEAGTRQPSVKALRRLAARLGVSAEYLETGSQLDPGEKRELRLTDLELAMRLGGVEDVEGPLNDLVQEAIAAGDRICALRGRVALAALAKERGDFERAAALLEASVADEEFLPVEHFEVYGELAQAYAASGRAGHAVELLERCLAAVADAGDDPGLEARYASLLSYALSDAGDLLRAEQVVQHALDRVEDTADPYMRVRLYWSMARLAYTEGRDSIALANVRKAIALLQATDDTIHLARAHILAAMITLSRDDADRAEQHLDQSEKLLGPNPGVADLVEIKVRRSRIAALRGDAETAVELAREALAANGDSPADQGLALAVLADALALAEDTAGADEAYARAVDLLEEQRLWRDATQACRGWARMLRSTGREQQALDVLDRAAELGLRGLPAELHADR